MNRSHDWFAQAEGLMVGGVNSPVRAFRAVGGTPVVFERGEGPWLEDLDGKRYIDFVLAWGPLILGHAPANVRQALEAGLRKGWSFGAPTPPESALAAEILRRHPGLEKIRFVCSGTEATMSALRLARAATGRDKIVKFAGGYHGHADCLLAEAGSGLATAGVPASAGVSAAQAADTFVLPYNNPAALEDLFAREGARIAAVIVEPVAGNMGVIPPEGEFITTLNHLPKNHGALLILDEVMTGFRVGASSARGHYGYEADLVCFGKVIGGGLPVGAYAGPAVLMDKVAPLGPVYQAGTMSGNPLAMIAGLETLKALDAAAYRQLESCGSLLERGLREVFARHHVPVTVTRAGSLLGVFLCTSPVRDFAAANRTDTRLYARWFHAALEEGVYLPPSAYEAFFLSTAHDEAVCTEALVRLERALKTALAAA